MIAFWIAAMGAVALAAGLMFLFLRRPVPLVQDPAQAVYRRQLAEIDDLAGRGLLGEEERKAAHAEAARRLIGEPGAEAERPATSKEILFASAMIGLVGVIALGAYLVVGRPGMPDQPYKARLDAWAQRPVSELRPEELLALADRAPPEAFSDPGFLSVYGDLQAQTGDLLSAERTFERRLDIEPNDAESWVALARIRMALAREEVSPAARQALERALALDPQNTLARYILATDDIARGRRAEGVAVLRALVAVVPPEARSQIEREIAAAEAGDGGPAANPAAADPAIRSMVQGLANRLKENPDDPQGWARLVRSYHVMGDIAARDAALAEARRLFAGRPRDLAAIEQAMDAPQ